MCKSYLFVQAFPPRGCEEPAGLVAFTQLEKTFLWYMLETYLSFSAGDIKIHLYVLPPCSWAENLVLLFSDNLCPFPLTNEWTGEEEAIDKNLALF